MIFKTPYARCYWTSNRHMMYQLQATVDSSKKCWYNNKLLRLLIQLCNEQIYYKVCFLELSTIFKGKTGQRLRQGDVLYPVLFNLAQLKMAGNIPSLQNGINRTLTQ